jgi:signal transduction histidine kinase
MPASPDPLERIDRADSIQSWLEAHDIPEAWELAPTLVSSGWDTTSLDEIKSSLSNAELGCSLEDIIRYVAASSSLYALVDEVHQSTERISQIVNAVKSYSYLDQAPIQEVDVHDGLENTLVILQHKLKQGVVIRREYSHDLPRIEAFGSELNQVWTNIIDNAVDAMQGKGELTLRTYSKDDNVVVEIGDNGPGIPADIQPRIFDAFFTTKPPGSGSGLGLHTSYNIVVHRHKGLIQVKSQPGGTCFQVTLPVHMRRSTG